MNTEFQRVFKDTPMIALKRSKNLQEIIGDHTVKQGNVFKKNLTKLNGNSLQFDETITMLHASIEYANIYESTNKNSL